MDYQIILLPTRDYWTWVRACREYVMRYGANLTSDRQTAGNYMAPMQVITVPTSDRLRAEMGDLVQWFEDNHPGVRVDAVKADSPAEFEATLQARLRAEDRYGQRQKPFYLLWPTNYPMVTQKFGANPQIYTRFGMPGHEGLDIRALPGTEVYCCAAGTVYRVHSNPNSHAYGIHVRVRHSNGYRTVYGHLAQAQVTVGQELEAGQVLGKADSTGASTASHLHLTLKQDGATARGETSYPKDVVDPTPFMVWPESTGKGLPAEEFWPAGRCLIGVHGRLDAPMSGADLRWIREADIEAVKLGVHEPGRTVEKLRQEKPDLFLVTRLEADLSVEPVSATNFIDSVLESALAHYRAGVRNFEIGATPNLQLAGWNRSWRSGRDYAGWFEQVTDQLAQKMERATFGFPGLSPGGQLSGWRQDEWAFLEGAEQAVARADWVGVICHWSDDASMGAPAGGRRYLQYRKRYTEKLLMITEFNNLAQDVTREARLQQYRRYYRMVRHEPGMAAAFAFPLASKGGYLGSSILSDEAEDLDFAHSLSERDF